MRLFSHLLAFLFHPLLILTIGLLFLLSLDPYSFGVARVRDKIPLVVITLLYTFFLPLITTLFMSFTGLIKSAALKDRQERIGPLIGAIIFYTWFYLNMVDNPEIPKSFNVLILGSLFALGLSFVVTVFTKVSLHCVGMGGLIGFSLIAFWSFGYDYLSIGSLEVHLSLVIIGALLLAGLIGTSRLYLGAHISKDIYGGYLIGLTSQFIALRFLV